MCICVDFHKEVQDNNITFVVICAKYKGKWVWAKHKHRDTLELPGGHCESGESIMESARRELEEETGAIFYTIEPVCFYRVKGKTRVNEKGCPMYGGLYYAQIEQLGSIHSEIECITFHDTLPSNLTYPSIQPVLLKHVQAYINKKA